MQGHLSRAVPAGVSTGKTRDVALEETHDLFSHSGLANLDEDYLARYFGQLLGGKTAAYIHRDGLARFQDR